MHFTQDNDSDEQSPTYPYSHTVKVQDPDDVSKVFKMKILQQKPLKSILKPKGKKNTKGINFDLDQNIVEEFWKDQRVDWIVTQDMK